MDSKFGIETLTLARDALATFNVRHFLIDGTLLGLVREGRFLDKDDEDIDIGVLAEDFTIYSFGLFRALMRRKGFSLEHFDGVWGTYFVTVWFRDNLELDVFFYFRRGNQRIAYELDSSHIRGYYYPAWLIENLSPVDFYGKSFMAPKHKEAVLAHQYGDWTIPRPDWDSKTSSHNIDLTRRTRWNLLQSRLSNALLRRIWSTIEMSRRALD
jgi:hypothetical protein